jgi:hypothetical protein
MVSKAGGGKNWPTCWRNWSDLRKGDLAQPVTIVEKEI